MKDGGRVAAALAIALFAFVVLQNGWIHDDAYITFRTVDNLVNGYGLRWNPAERVQTYTHPLWMFVIAAEYALTREVFFTVIVTSVAVSMATAFLIVFGVARSLAAGCLGVAILTLSKAFVDYSTSGLENPLTHLLFAGFLVVCFRRDATPTTLFFLSLLAALAAVNRLDTLLLYLPVLIVVLFGVERGRGAAACAAGLLPLVLWEAFSIFYYGFPFPNTAYAKLFDTGLGRSDRVLHGMYYLLNSVRLDPLTLVTIAGAIAASLWSTDRRVRAVCAGIAAYLAYVVWIGGDFVTGRFLTAPLLGAVVLLSRLPLRSYTAIALAAGVIVAVALVSRDSPLLGAVDADGEHQELMDAHGIADERPYYAPFTGFRRAVEGTRVSSHPWAREGLEARRTRLPVVVRGDIGFFGFYAGPQVHIVDVWGLADPLIARLPASTDGNRRVGHFTRAIPDGYVETLATGQNRIVDRNLAVMYEKLSRVTRSPLLDADRLREIWNLNVRPDHGR